MSGDLKVGVRHYDSTSLMGSEKGARLCRCGRHCLPSQQIQIPFYFRSHAKEVISLI